MNEVKKYKSLLNSLQNLGKNDVTSQLKKKHHSEGEKAFLNALNGVPYQEKPEATYLNLAVAITLKFLLTKACMKLTLTSCEFDIHQINLLARENIVHYLKESDMIFDLEWASDFIAAPLSMINKF